MKLYRLSLVAFCCLLMNTISAQDKHFTMFNHAPITLNPANTGSYEGTFRVGGIFRDQGFSNGNVYVTPSFYIDAPILTVRKRDWISVGGVFISDKAGQFFKNQLQHLVGAYHLSLNKKQTSVLSLGVAWGTVTHRLDKTATPLFPDESTTFPAAGYADENMTSDWNTGLMFKSKLNKVTDIKIGFSLNHFIKFDSTSLNLVDQPRWKLPTRFTLHGEYDVQVTDQWSIHPKFLFQKIAAQDEAVVQFLAGYSLLKREIRKDGRKGKLLKDDEAPVFKFGVGYRLADAAQFIFGYEWKGLQAGIAYDLTLSGLNEYNSGNGAFEIGASYIFKIYKKPTVDPVILCPKF